MRSLRPILLGILLLPATLPSTVCAEDEVVDRSIAIVNHHVITETELIDESKDIIKQLSTKKEITLPPLNEIYSQVLEHLILKTAQEDLAEQYGIRIRDEEINERLTLVAKQNGLSLTEMRDLMEKQDPDSFIATRNAVKTELTLEELRNQEVVARIRVTPEEVKHFVQRKLGLNNEQRVRYHLQHMLIALPDTPTPEQIAQVKAKANGIWQQLTLGEDNFSQLAIRYSADAKALEGGVLGWVGLVEGPTLLEDTVLQLGENETSKPVQSPLGFHILRLLGRDVEKISANAVPADIETQAMKILRNQKGNQLYEQWLRRVRDEAFVKILAPEYQRD